ncbi:hypothetical protein [Ekhidna lutea]|uniref:hypothetical protein n=1 Tax=Ekhidna lutea TaxID=447679 RepID=UPI00117D11FF|nr:hypothetical protein [Ekhidna lutea]
MNNYSFDFIDKPERLHPTLTEEILKNDAKPFFNYIHSDDIDDVKNHLRSTKNEVLNIDFRLTGSRSVRYVSCKAISSENEDGSVFFKGCFEDNTIRINQKQILNKILFDFTHSISNKLDNIISLTDNLNCKPEDTSSKQIIEEIKGSSAELAAYLKEASEEYRTLQA